MPISGYVLQRAPLPSAQLCTLGNPAVRGRTRGAFPAGRAMEASPAVKGRARGVSPAGRALEAFPAVKGRSRPTSPAVRGRARGASPAGGGRAVRWRWPGGGSILHNLRSRGEGADWVSSSLPKQSNNVNRSSTFLYLLQNLPEEDQGFSNWESLLGGKEVIGNIVLPRFWLLS